MDLLRCYMGHLKTPDNVRLGWTTIKGKKYRVRRCRKCERRNQSWRRWGIKR